MMSIHNKCAVNIYDYMKLYYITMLLLYYDNYFVTISITTVIITVISIIINTIAIII
jgi:hypothetical protein